jgi:hypothetical protein
MVNKTIKKTSTVSIFSQDDFNSNDGFLTRVWGAPAWHFLHTISFNYPIHPTKKQKKDYMSFILNLKNVLPCGKCRDNLENNFKKLPLTFAQMKSRDTFSRYVYELHEVINTMLCKKSGLSYNDVRERYEHFRSRCFNTTKNVKHIMDSHSSWSMANKTRKLMENKKNKKNGKHSGCVEPLYGKKSKCVLRIIPDEEKCESIEIDKKCLATLHI